jgi:hypothetical protein
LAAGIGRIAGAVDDLTIIRLRSRRYRWTDGTTIPHWSRGLNRRLKDRIPVWGGRVPDQSAERHYESPITKP